MMPALETSAPLRPGSPIPATAPHQLRATKIIFVVAGDTRVSLFSQEIFFDYEK